MSEELIGEIIHYYGKPHVAAMKVTNGRLKVGDMIHVVGHTSNFIQRIDSMEIEHATVGEARVGDNVGLQVIEHAREHDKVYRMVLDD